MINEIYKPVIGYKGLYKVSNLGNVISLPRKGTDGRMVYGKELSKNGILNSKTPYLSVSLYKDNRKSSIRIHRLVAEAFLDKIPNKTHVNHIDGNKKNNVVDNLEWVDRKENANHALNSGLMDNALKLISEANSKEVIVMNLTTNEIETFKSRVLFSEHLGHNPCWFSSLISKKKDINKQLNKKGYELLNNKGRFNGDFR